MTLDASWSLQTALYDALSNDAELSALVGSPPRIFDAIPPEAAFPMVQIGAGRMTPFAGVAGGYEHVLRITAYSRWGGHKECKLIAGHIHRVLQNARLTLEGHDMVQARMVFEDHLRMRDPDLVQASMRYRFVTVPKAVAA